MSSNSSSLNNSFPPFGFIDCSVVAGIQISDIVFNITRFLLILPLSVFILYLAYQRWKQQGSLTAVSHCDVFTYHLAVMELFTSLGIVFVFVGYFKVKLMGTVGFWIFYVPYTGETFFHALTCVERYLAVVHPHTYMGLKTARGIRIRNAFVGCIWFFCFAWVAINVAVYPYIPIFTGLSIMTLWLVVVIFCSLSVLFVLVRSKPGESGKGGVDKSKQRAFLTIMVILVVLCLWVGGFVVGLSVNFSTSPSPNAKCAVMQMAYWMNIPSCLVLPLLYLQRTGKLPFCCRT